MLQAEQLLQERYRLQQQLGNNASRQTWLAQDLATTPPTPVIVKFLAFSPQMQWEELKLFEREAQVLKSLNLPRIPRHRDYFSLDAVAGEGLHWFVLVQDYIPGKSLQELLEEGYRFTEEQVRAIAVQILEILRDLHGFNPPILHRDIKPSNLILSNSFYNSPQNNLTTSSSNSPQNNLTTSSSNSPQNNLTTSSSNSPQNNLTTSSSNSPLSKGGRGGSQDSKPQVYLIDFGAVCDVTSVEGATFTVVGTAGYAPLEQFWGKAVPASDLYALGATLIHLLTGIPPSELPQQNLRLDFRKLVTLDSNLVSWLETLTEPDLERRFASAEQALTAFATGSTLPKLAKPAGSQVRLAKSAKTLTVKIPPKARSLARRLQLGLTLLRKAIVLNFSRIFFLLPSILGISTIFWTLLQLIQGNLTVYAWVVPIILTLVSLWSWRQNKVATRSLILEVERWAEREFGFSTMTLFREEINPFGEPSRKECYRLLLEPSLRLLGIVNVGRKRHHDLENLNAIEATPWNGIVIEIDAEKYVLGKHLSERECEWIVREIEDWLAEIKRKRSGKIESQQS